MHVHFQTLLNKPPLIVTRGLTHHKTPPSLNITNSSYKIHSYKIIIHIHN